MNPNADFQKTMANLDALYDSYWPYVIALIIALVTTLRSYMAGQTCPSDERIPGKKVLITGASSGIGREIALELAKRGGQMILAVRDVEAGEKVAKKIRKFGGAAEVKKLDLSSLKDICQFAKNLEIEKIDILINNAGIALHPYEKTEEGFEMHFVTNYLGHFLLTHLLLPKIKLSEQGRIINVSAAQALADSDIHLEDLNLEKDFSAKKSFGQSKLALILMARHMAKLLEGTGVTINAVDPGLVRGTKHLRRSPLGSTFLIKLFMQPWMWLLLKTPIQGAQTCIFSAVSSELNGTSGKLLRDCAIASLSGNCLDNELSEKLYIKSMDLLNSYLQSCNTSS